MMRRFWPLLLAALGVFSCAAPPASSKGRTYRVYYLGGQSNMVGFGFNKDLPEELRRPVPGVFIFHGNTCPDGEPVDGRGVWSRLEPGHGVGFRSDGRVNVCSDRFGCELALGRRLAELEPGAGVALIKYSREGTSIDLGAAGTWGCWDPDYAGGEGEGKGINQYDHFLATLRNAFAARDIDGDGEPDTLIPAGIVWMQGESDAARGGEETARRYEANLKRLMDLVRAALRVDDLPVVIGRISDSGNGGKPMWRHGDIVRAAQAAFCGKDPAAALVTRTDAYLYSDPWHYDSAGYLDLGREFAEALVKLRRTLTLWAATRASRMREPAAHASSCASRARPPRSSARPRWERRRGAACRSRCRGCSGSRRRARGGRRRSGHSVWTRSAGRIRPPDAAPRRWRAEWRRPEALRPEGPEPTAPREPRPPRVSRPPSATPLSSRAHERRAPRTSST
jgi:hypothetical protein